MAKLSHGRVPSWLVTLLHLHDSPRRTAVAYALGVFFGFSPFFGVQTLCSMTLAFAFNLNRAAVFAGLCTNLPWILPPWYVLTTTCGAFLLGTRLPEDSSRQLRALFQYSVLHQAFWWQLADVVRPLLWPFIVGSTVGAAVVAAVSYRVALGLMLRRRSHAESGL